MNQPESEQPESGQSDDAEQPDAEHPESERSDDGEKPDTGIEPPKPPRQKEGTKAEVSDKPKGDPQGYMDWGAHVRPSDSKGPDTTATLEPLAHATPEQWLGTNNDPDVLLSIPNLGIDHIGLNVKNIRAHVDLHAKVLDLVEINVGADVSIDEVDLQINNVRVQAMLKVKLDKVAEIVGRVVDLLDNHPEILENLTGGLGRGLEGALAGNRPLKLDDNTINQLSAAVKEIDQKPTTEEEQ